MKKELVFFLQTSKAVAGTQMLLVQLASHIAETTDTVTYFVNDEIESLPKGSLSKKLTISTVEDFRFSSHNRAVYVTLTNYIFHLLAHLKKCGKARVLCINNYADIIKALLNQMPAELRNAEAIVGLLCEKSALLFMSKNCTAGAETHLPEGEPSSFLAETNGFVQPEKVACAPVISDEKKIRVAWYGPLHDGTIHSFESLLTNLMRVHHEKNVEVHIVGDGRAKWSVNYAEYAPRLSFYYAPLSDHEEMEHDYIRNNADVVFTYGPYAIRTAAAGLPTAIVPTARKVYRENQYLFFHETDGAVLSWGPGALRNGATEPHTIVDIVDSVCDEATKQQISDLCYEHYLNCHSLSHAAELLMDTIAKSSLKVEDCFSVSEIGAHLAGYEKARQEKEIQTYPEYVDYLVAARTVKVETKPTLKDRLRSTKEGFAQFKTDFKQKHPGLVRMKKQLPNFKFLRVQWSYPGKLRRIAKKAQREGSVKVAFLLVFNSVFPTRPVFEAMLENDRFDPYIVIAPNVSRTHVYQMEIYKEAVEALKEQYPGRVVETYDETYDTYMELDDTYSLIFYCNPYPRLVHYNHGIDYFYKKDVLPIYMNYGFAALSFWDEVLSSDFYNKVWMACIETNMNLQYLKRNQQIRGKNGVVTGYLKMDKMASITPEERTRKRILVCPHHTVWGWSTLNIGNFLKYYEFFQELPEKYPDVDFVFRPHPLLFQNLLVRNIWSQEQIDDYIARMDAHPNACYDHSGDYLEQFVNSDAMIHDCGSFIGEYLYTEKPCCYMLKTEEQAVDGLVPLGQKCMENYYKAFSEEDIIRFIDEVVLHGQDPMKEQREKFAREELKFNYPHAADDLIALLEKKLFGKGKK